jgi:N-acetylglucosaminyl-diphospho-decaprenol L-rhamnosyltransferase
VTAPALSILMLSWNTRELTLDALRTIYEHPPASRFEVVVVDNASQDASADAIAERFPEVVLVRHDTNSGYGPGNNIAFRHSAGEAVLLLGSDTRVGADTLDTLLSTLHEHPEAGAVTCRVEGPTGYPEGTCLDFPTLRDGAALYLSLPRFARHLPTGKFDFGRQQGVQQVSGTCLLLRRSLVERIGLFDEGYKILYTDVELCQRVHDAGRTILYTPATSLVHLGNRSCVQATGRLRAQMYEDILRYYISRFGARGVVVMLPILLARLAAVNRGSQVWRLLRPEALRAPAPQFGGTRP